jgi:hypothetical protein
MSVVSASSSISLSIDQTMPTNLLPLKKQTSSYISDRYLIPNYQSTLSGLYERSYEYRASTPIINCLSLQNIIKSSLKAIGLIFNEKIELGSCVLISRDLALLPYHVIEGLDSRKLKAIFESIKDGASNKERAHYSVLRVVENDPVLNYAVIKLEKHPGFTHVYLPVHTLSHQAIEPRQLEVLQKKLSNILFYFYNALSLHSLCIPLIKALDDKAVEVAYIDLTGTIKVLYLGTARNEVDLNFCKKILVIDDIIYRNPNGILALLKRQQIIAIDILTEEAEPIYYLSPYQRDYA